MRIDRAARFGVVAAIGITAISWVTFGLARMARAGLGNGEARFLLVVVAGTVVNLVFLFAVVGVFVDRKLAARGLVSPDE